jgi:hypothetical protein
MQLEEDKTTGEVFLPPKRQFDNMILGRKEGRIPGRREGRIDVKWNILDEYKNLPNSAPISYGGKIVKSREEFVSLLGLRNYFQNIHLVKPFSIGPEAKNKGEGDWSNNVIHWARMLNQGCYSQIEWVGQSDNYADHVDRYNYREVYGVSPETKRACLYNKLTKIERGDIVVAVSPSSTYCKKFGVLERFGGQKIIAWGLVTRSLYHPDVSIVEW